MREDGRAATGQHIAIAGAGIIGLACALALERRGWRVTVLDAGIAMKEASWAAGGMLAENDPENPAALLPLCRYSRRLYGQFLEEIEALSGRQVPLRTTETIQVIGHLSHLEPGRIEGPGRILSAQEACQRVPDLADISGDLLLLEESSIDPRDLCTALPRAVQAAGASLREQERVLSLENAGGAILLQTTRGLLRADAFLNCCGAWTPSLYPSSQEMPCGLGPRKGQMLVVAQPDGAPLPCVLRSADVYLIPRGDGRIVIGATVEDAGFSKTVHRDALDDLRRRAAALWPPALHATTVESWAGLRPASADDLPVIGALQSGGVHHFVAAGHYRNGILLAPGTAEIVADLIDGDAPAIDITPFAPSRATAGTTCDKRFAPAL